MVRWFELDSMPQPCHTPGLQHLNTYLVHYLWEFEHYVAVEYYFSKVRVCYICLCCRIML